MSKAIFRWLRGELNGFYLTNMYNTLNKSTEEIRSFLMDFRLQQFVKGEISEETLFGLGRFAGIFLPRMSSSDSTSSLFMTDSEVVDGEEYSERGLYNTANESFDFYHTEQTEGLPDINTEADKEHRSSLVGTEEIEGYISEIETDVIDDDGYVKRDKVLDTPPENGAYSEFYGDNFLLLSEAKHVYKFVSYELFFDLFKTLQWIRYNGASMSSLLKVIEILCPDGLVKIDRMEVGIDGNAVYIYYNYNNKVTLSYKEQRLYLLNYIVSLKFKQLVLIENQL